MKPDQLATAADPKLLSAYLAKLPMAMPHHHGGGSVDSVRTADHKGHHIVLHTTYQVEVDGRHLDIPLGVDNDGQVHCHALPNYQFSSAIDMIKQLIDSFPDDFIASRKRRSPKARPHARPKRTQTRRTTRKRH